MGGKAGDCERDGGSTGVKSGILDRLNMLRGFDEESEVFDSFMVPS